MEYITMSTKELKQTKVFEMLKDKQITQKIAALKLNVTTRWIRKKLKRYIESGDKGLVHQNRGRPSKRRWNENEKSLTLDLLRSEWHGFGPTFAAEKLAELKGIRINKETLRQVMIVEGIWQAKNRKLKHRKRRERRRIRGLFIQLDGSPHDWFEGRGPWCTLLVFIDDATSQILWLEFVKSESNIAVMQATKNYIEQYGIPHAFYVDFGKVFSVNLNNEERDKKTQWERAMEELGIKIDHAHSPQAKGRVERANKTMQDRLEKELRLAGVSSIEEANEYLRKSDFIVKHNERFGVSPAESGDAHRPIDGYDLESIICLREERVLANDYTILFKKRIFQLTSKQPAIIRPKDKITVNTALDGRIWLSIRKQKLHYREIEIKPLKPEREIHVSDIPRKTHPNSRRWCAGLAPVPTGQTGRVG